MFRPESESHVLCDTEEPPMKEDGENAVLVATRLARVTIVNFILVK